jgi:hypothetical protein
MIIKMSPSPFGFMTAKEKPGVKWKALALLAWLIA